nr:hypothetical protein [Tanacetum cinerariifolium]
MARDQEQVLGVKRWSEKPKSTDLHKEEEYLKNVEKLLLDAQEECEYVKFEKDTLSPIVHTPPAFHIPPM